MTEYDVFMIGGQSNAVGDGDETQSPDPTADTSYFWTDLNGGTLFQMDDPVQNARSAEDSTTDPFWDATTGSAWPQFAVDYFNKTSRKTVFVQTALGGSEQCVEIEDGDGQHWDDNGNLYPESVALTNQCLTFLENNGDTARFRGVLWLQGESDGAAINASNLTQQTYQDAFENMISKYRTEYGSNMPFWIIEVGDKQDESYPEIREVQQDVALSQDHTYLVSDKQKNFPEQGLMVDNSHYNQEGLNIVGEVSALNVAAALNTQFQFKRGDTTANDNYTGQPAELTVDTATDRVRIHDGATQGGEGTIPRLDEV